MHRSAKSSKPLKIEENRRKYEKWGCLVRTPQLETANINYNWIHPSPISTAKTTRKSSLPFLSTHTRILDSVETTPLKQRRSAQTPLSQQISSMVDFSSISAHLVPLGGSKTVHRRHPKSARFRESQTSVGEIHWIIFFRFCYHGSIKLYDIYIINVQTVTGITQ